jgi:hypothetical protein
MKFDELEAKMRVFETANDRVVLPEIYIVARIDGRGFTRLTKEVHAFAAPFDEQFRDMMVATVAHLMDCGFRIVYGYTQSDEISLLFHQGESTFSRKARKLNSILAGEASAKFSLLLGDLAAFHASARRGPHRRTRRSRPMWSPSYTSAVSGTRATIGVPRACLRSLPFPGARPWFHLRLAKVALWQQFDLYGNVRPARSIESK